MKQEEKNQIKEIKKVNILKRLSSEFRKIRWTTWKLTKKSFIVTLFALIFMSAIFFGLTIAITELFKVMGII